MHTQAHILQLKCTCMCVCPSVSMSACLKACMCLCDRRTDEQTHVYGRKEQIRELDTQTEQHSVSQPSRCRHRQKYVQTEGQIYVHEWRTDGWTDVKTDRRRDRLTYIHTDGRTDIYIQTDRQTTIQTNFYLYSHTFIHTTPKLQLGNKK